MLGLTTLGLIHTAISLVAVGAALVAFFRYQLISPRTMVGKVYVVTTLLTCVTALGIYQHGGFGKPHAVAIITLVTLAVAAVAGRTRFFGRAARYVEAVAYTATFLFHLIPATVETSTRLPVGHPLAANPDVPGLQVAAAVLVVAFLIGASLQVWWMRGGHGLVDADEETRAS